MVELTGRVTRLPTLAGYGALLRSQLFVIVLVTALGGLGGYWWQAQKPQFYRASAAILLPDIPVYVDLAPDGTTPEPATIDTTAQLVLSGSVLRSVSDATAQPLTAVHDGLSVSAYPLSRVLIVSFEAAAAETAITGANEAARATLEERAQVLAGARLDEARKLFLRLDELRSRAEQDASQFPVVSRRIDTRMAYLDGLLTGREAAVGRVIHDARPAERIGIHPELPVTTGLVTGFTLAVGWAWWRRPPHSVAVRRRLSAAAG